MSTSLANSLLVTPGKAFCSWMAVLIPFLAAARTTGPLTYPPQPMTKSGSTVRKMAAVRGPDKARWYKAARLRPMFCTVSLR